MKLKAILTGCLLSAACFSQAADCEMFIQVVPADGVSNEVNEIISSRLINALNASGSVASSDYGQFIISAKCNDLYKEVVGGGVQKVAVHAELMVAVADISDGTVFASKNFDISGVGSTEERAYINALKSISGTNKGLITFVNEAKSKMIGYFDRNYQTLLSKAKQAASLQEYRQALYYTTLIPSCSKGYDEAMQATLRYYKDYVNEDGASLLNAAKAAFSISPNADGAANAYALLAQISTQSSAYPAALAFAEEVKAQTKAEYVFDKHKKYQDQIDLRQAEINAAKEIGVAYGRGQKDKTTNILWK